MKYVFTDGLRKVLADARMEAVALDHGFLSPLHILLAILGDAESAGTRSAAIIVLAECGAEPEELRRRSLACVTPGRGSGRRVEALPYTSSARRALEKAVGEARELGHPHVGTEHVLLALLQVEQTGQLLRAAGVTLEAARNAARAMFDVGLRRPRQAFKIELDDASSLSIYEQIVTRVKEAVALGRLEPGDRLPSVRRLADELDIAPGTVARAYAELERQGVVVTEGARGTRIAEPGKREVPEAERPETLVGLLRPVAVAAFHLGATAEELRAALEAAMRGTLLDG